MAGVIEPRQQCRGPRLARMCGYGSDTCGADLAGRQAHNYVPRDLGIGGDTDHLRHGLDCGKIRGAFPVPTTAIEEARV